MLDLGTWPRAGRLRATRDPDKLARLRIGTFGVVACMSMPSVAWTQAGTASQHGLSPIRSEAGTTRLEAAGEPAIRPFRFRASDEALADLRRRIGATKWPGRETVPDGSQGVQLATMQKLARYWANDYDWRRFEARLNALPQFVTNVDGLDIHFIHVKSKQPNALPIILTHGWPGSIVEMLKVVDPLTNPTAHGGSAADAFDVVIPSLPGYGFSGQPTAGGWEPVRIARAWTTLMRRLGYTRYVAQGGDWGDPVTEQMAVQAPEQVIGIHSNMPAAVPPEILKAAQAGAPAPAGLSPDERRAYDQLAFFFTKGLAYAQEMGNRPQTLYAIEDSPVGLAAWILDHDARSSPTNRYGCSHAAKCPPLSTRL